MNEETSQTNSATWKFKFLDTVNADPACTPASLKVIKAYLHFASETTPRAFISIGDLCLRTALARPTVIRTKAKLEKLGYLVPLGPVGDGAIQYRLVNAREQLIADHLAIGRQKLLEDSRQRKKIERNRLHTGGNKMIPPNSDRGYRNLTPVLNKMIPNSLEVIPRDSILEQRGILKSAESENLTPPDDPEDARMWLFKICSDKSRLTWALGLLAENKLTPAIIREIAA